MCSAVMGEDFGEDDPEDEDYHPGSDDDVSDGDDDDDHPDFDEVSQLEGIPQPSGPRRPYTLFHHSGPGDSRHPDFCLPAQSRATSGSHVKTSIIELIGFRVRVLNPS